MVAACAYRHDKSTGQTQGKGNKQQIAQPHNANEDTRQQIAHNAADAAGVAQRNQRLRPYLFLISGDGIDEQHRSEAVNTEAEQGKGHYQI